MTHVRVQVRVPEGTDDLLLELSDQGVTVGEVFGALGLPDDTDVDGQLVAEPTAVRAVDALVAGSQLTAPGVVRTVTADSATDALVDVGVIAGLDAARTTQLHAGEYRVDGRWLVQIAESPLTRMQPAAPWHVHGSQVEAVMADGAAIAMSPPVISETLSGWTVHRPPRHVCADAPQPVERIEAPAGVREPAPLSWSTLLAPIPIALMMALFFRPIFALFAAMGPIMALGRWFESKRRYRRDLAARSAAITAMGEAVRQGLTAQAEAVAQLRWQSQPHVGELWRRARNRSVRLWERRPGSPGYLEFSIGIGPDEIAALSAGASPDPVAHRALDEPMAIRPVPHLVDLQQNIGVGVYGHRNHAVAIVRSALLQLVTLHGPADLKVGLVCRQAACADWDWLKWLPHTDTALTATSCGPIAKAMVAPAAGPPARSNLATPPEEPVQLIVVDHADGDVASIQRAAQVAGIAVRFLVVAPRLTALPAACSALIEVCGSDAAGLDTKGLGPGVTALITAPQAQRPGSVVCPIGLSEATAASWARSLSAMIDPEATDFGGADETGVSLLQLLQFQSVDELARRWAHRPIDAAAVTPIGASSDGPFLVNLSEDGPHGLVAGTTGSGKSELLRTLVIGLAFDSPPDLVNFVLIDFKGGGAFDAVAQLPHVAGFITDLDESLVARAIASLRSELHRRETLFRELGVSSFEEALRQADDSLARLVVVIDEFATLATEYAELMSSIIDLAARGRSLGMHLVLATQRPSGVVDQKIRANTNLRVALRVQDAVDSHDVVGTGAAAAIDRRSPGRAVVSVGGDMPITVQTAFSGALDRASDRCAVRPLRLFDAAAAPIAHPDCNDTSTELRVLVDAIVAVSATHGYIARPLWQEPLPARLDWIDLGVHDLGSAQPAEGAALGLEDVPDLQLQRPWRWNPDSGPLALYSASAVCAAKVLVSTGAALASADEPDSVHLYVIDGDSGRAAALRNLTHTGAYVTLAETDRIERTIRFFESQLSRRRAKQAHEADPRLLLMVDNVAAVFSTFGDVQAADLVDRLSAIARDGTPQRIHVVVTARTVRDIGHRLSQQFPNRLVLALADMGGYLTLGLKARDVPLLPEMRAVDLATRRLVQLVEPPDLTSWNDSASHQKISEKPSSGPRPILKFPDEFSASELGPATIVDGVLHIPLGVESDWLEHVALGLRPGEHALVVAANGMGRSETVRLIVQQLQALDSCLDVVLVTPHLRLDREVVVSVDRPTVVVIDDGDQLDAETTKAIEEMLEAGHSHVRVIAATTPLHARSARSWVPRIRASGVGLLIGGVPGDGDVFGARLRPIVGLGRLPGRGYLIGRGQMSPTQFGRL